MEQGEEGVGRWEGCGKQGISKCGKRGTGYLQVFGEGGRGSVAVELCGLDMRVKRWRVSSCEHSP